MALRNNQIITRWTNADLITIRANTNNQYWYNNYGNYYYNIQYNLININKNIFINLKFLLI